MSAGGLVETVIVAADEGLSTRLGAAVGVDAIHLAPEKLAPVERVVPLDPAAARVVWVHCVPSRARPEGDDTSLEEAELLVRSAALARASAAALEARLAFICLLPSRGLLEGPAGLAAELARGAFQGLVNAGMADWAAAGGRISAVVYGGLEGEPLVGQRAPAEVLRRTPAGRLAGLEEIAAAVRYLGSNAAEYVTGIALHVDGGWNAYSWVYPARTT